MNEPDNQVKLEERARAMIRSYNAKPKSLIPKGREEDFPNLYFFEQMKDTLDLSVILVTIQLIAVHFYRALNESFCSCS